MSDLTISGRALEERPESVTVGGVRYVPDDGRDRNRLHTEDVMVALAFVNALGYGYDADTDSMGLFHRDSRRFVAWCPNSPRLVNDDWIRMTKADLLIACLTPVAYWKVDGYPRHFGDREEAVDFSNAVGVTVGHPLVAAYSAEGKVIPGR